MKAGSLLVIGYGNTLRGDDGVGVKVAEAVAALNLSGVRVVTSQQLTPELAEVISQASSVVFVDGAADAACGAELREVPHARPAQILAHRFDPASLLALADALFGHQPRAWLLAVAMTDVGIGEGLSPAAGRNMKEAVEIIKARRDDWSKESVEKRGQPPSLAPVQSAPDHLY